MPLQCSDVGTMLIVHTLCLAPIGRTICERSGHGPGNGFEHVAALENEGNGTRRINNFEQLTVVTKEGVAPIG